MHIIYVINIKENMSKLTNINIISGTKIFPYAIQYIPIEDSSDDYGMSSKCELGSEWMRIGDYWEKRKNWVPLWNVKSKSATIRICFPEFSVETYSENSDYVLDVYTFIANYKLDLGSYRLNRKDSLAITPFTYQGNIYYECIDIKIPDAQEIIYGNSWSNVRKTIKDNIDYNNDSSTLLFSLHAVDSVHDKLIKKNLYEGGQNAINISKNSSDYLRTSLALDDKFHINIHFNPAYDTIEEYMLETYGWSNLEVIHMLTVDNGNVAPILESRTNDFSLSGKLKELFSDWSKWKLGMKFVSKTILRYNDNEMILSSNPLPISMDIFSKLILSEKIKLPDEMNINNLHITNKVESSSIHYDIPENSKSNIIIPIFYRVRDLGHVVIHPQVNENICINLDAYKSKVDYFVLQIEGMKFKEIGTVPSGTIFKVIGSSLPQSSIAGTFYILDHNGDLVTTGKYTYES